MPALVLFVHCDLVIRIDDGLDVPSLLQLATVDALEKCIYNYLPTSLFLFVCSCITVIA